MIKNQTAKSDTGLKNGIKVMQAPVVIL